MNVVVLVEGALVGVAIVMVTDADFDELLMVKKADSVFIEVETVVG